LQYFGVYLLSERMFLFSNAELPPVQIDDELVESEANGMHESNDDSSEISSMPTRMKDSSTIRAARSYKLSKFANFVRISSW
jgi:hypothetical protein